MKPITEYTKQIDHKPLESAIKSLMNCSDVWFFEAGTYTLTEDYKKQKAKLISIMQSMLEEAGY
jgi:hypothetical protein